MPCAGASLKEFVIRSKRDEYRMAERSEQRLEFEALREETRQLNNIRMNESTAASIDEN